MQQAIIYSPAKTSMQSGTAKTGYWIVEYKSEIRKQADPLMGWAGGCETSTQLKLKFDTLEAAKAYALRENLSFTIKKPKKPRALKVKSYADNYAFNRQETWSH